jgi:hypothetical protein
VRPRIFAEGRSSGSRRIAGAAARIVTPSRANAPPRRERITWLVLLLAATLAGAWLRWYQLGIQVILDDEWHALHKVLSSDAWGIFTSFGWADHSIPLTLYYRFLLLHGGLTDWMMHLPMLLSGIALLVVAPLLLRDEITLPVRATWVALLGISPLLVYLAKTARPYALTSVLGFFAVVAFRRWWQSGRGATPWAAGYVAATVLAGWFHSTTLPFTLLPFAYYALRTFAALRSCNDLHRAWPALWRLLALFLATMLPLAALLAPPVLHDWPSLSGKAGVDSVNVDSLYRTFLMLFGVAQPAALALLGLLTGVGMFRLWSREPDLVAYLGLVALGGAAAIVAARPAWISHPLVLARYALPVLPVPLLFLAAGTVAVLERLPVPALRAAVVAVLAAGLFWIGPIPGYLYYPNQFIGHLRFQYDYDPMHNVYVQEVPSDPVPEFYRGLAQKPPGTITLIEAPWRLESNFNPHPWYQEIHRQYVKIGLVTPVCGVRSFGEYPATTAGVRLHQFVHLSQVLAGKSYGADYFVLHLVPWKTPPYENVEWPDVAACLPAIEAKLGPPVLRDAQMVVFDLKSKRSP